MVKKVVVKTEKGEWVEKRPKTFKTETSYRAWLGAGHAKGVFEKSPGQTPVTIKETGKKKFWPKEKPPKGARIKRLPERGKPRKPKAKPKGKTQKGKPTPRKPTSKKPVRKAKKRKKRKKKR